MTDSDIQTTRKDLRALAEEIVALSTTFQPSPATALGIEPELITKARELIRYAQTPMDHAVSLVGSSLQAITINTLLHLGALSAMPLDDTITLDKLSLATSTQPALLERLLRVVVGTGFVKQDDSGYSHTHLSAGYGKGGFAGSFFSFLNEAGTDILQRLPQYLDEKQINGVRVEPSSATHNPSTWHLGEEGKTIFEILQTDPEKLKRFTQVMGSVAHVNPYVGFYNFSQLAAEPGRVVFVDIGGGHGHAIMHMLRAHSDIRPEQCVLQDTEAVVKYAKSAETILPSGVQFQSHDYFLEQPVKHARAYHLRAIAHDLSDDNLVKVLKQIVPAMAPDSVVLIADNVIPDQGAQGLSSLMDMLMLAIGGKERTERTFQEVCEAAGLKVNAVYKVPAPKTYAIVEASLR